MVDEKAVQAFDLEAWCCRPLLAAMSGAFCLARWASFFAAAISVPAGRGEAGPCMWMPRDAWPGVASKNRGSQSPTGKTRLRALIEPPMQTGYAVLDTYAGCTQHKESFPRNSALKRAHVNQTTVFPNAGFSTRQLERSPTPLPPLHPSIPNPFRETLSVELICKFYKISHEPLKCPVARVGIFFVGWLSFKGTRSKKSEKRKQPTGQLGIVYADPFRGIPRRNGVASLSAGLCWVLQHHRRGILRLQGRCSCAPEDRNRGPA